MKLSQSAVALAVLLSLCSFVSAREGRPNVILVYADDQGSVDVNCYGAKDLMTPSLDGLAER